MQQRFALAPVLQAPVVYFLSALHMARLPDMFRRQHLLAGSEHRHGDHRDLTFNNNDDPIPNDDDLVEPEGHDDMLAPDCWTESDEQLKADWSEEGPELIDNEDAPNDVEEEPVVDEGPLVAEEAPVVDGGEWSTPGQERARLKMIKKAAEFA